jgi:hypothetical protein
MGIAVEKEDFDSGADQFVSNGWRPEAQHPATVGSRGRTLGDLEDSLACKPPLASCWVRSWQSDQQFLAGDCCQERGCRRQIFRFTEALGHQTRVGTLHTLENLMESCLALSPCGVNGAYNSSTVGLFVCHLSRLLRILVAGGDCQSAKRA